MPIVSGNDLADGVYIAIAPIQIGTNIYLNGLLVQLSTLGGSKACNIIYAEGLTRHGWYYNNGFKKDKVFQEYSAGTIARHINASLGTSFVGVNPSYMSDEDVNTELIVGKIEPVEGYSGLNNLNAHEDESADI